MIAGAHHVGVHRDFRTQVAVPHLAGQQILGRRALGRNPDRPGHDVFPHARADVGVLVLEVHLAIGAHFAAPGSDSGAPATKWDLLLVPLHIQGEAGEVHARLRDGFAVVIKGEVVPDIAPINLDGKIHLAAVVGRKLGRQEGHMQQLARQPLGAEGVQRAEHVVSGADLQGRHERVGVLRNEIWNGVLDPRKVLVGGRLLSPRHRTVFDDARRIGHPFHQDATEGVEVQVERLPLQGRQRLTAEKPPAENVVLALPSRQRLVGRQIELPVYVLGQQALARKARLSRPNGAQAHLATTRALDASPSLGILRDNQLEPFVAIMCRGARRFLGLGDLLVHPGGIPGRLVVLAARLFAALKGDRAIKGRQAGKVKVGVAGPGLVILDALEQDRKGRRNAIDFEKIGLTLQVHRPFGLGEDTLALRALCRLRGSRKPCGHQQRVARFWAFQEDVVRAFPIIGESDEGATVAVGFLLAPRPIRLAEDEGRPPVEELQVEEPLFARPSHGHATAAVGPERKYLALVHFPAFVPRHVLRRRGWAGHAHGIRRCCIALGAGRPRAGQDSQRGKLRQQT